MCKGNMTYLFERGKDSQDQGLRAPSESFWTTIVALFLLFLAKQGKERQLHVYQRIERQKSEHRPYYEPDKDMCVNLDGLTFENLTVEQWLKGVEKADWRIGGIKPDICFSVGVPSDRRKKYVLIENKIGTAELTSNQKDGYLPLREYLEQQDFDVVFLLLMSIGDNKTYERIIEMQQNAKRDGILLWEDVIRHMAREGFSLPGLDIVGWALDYTSAIENDAEPWPNGANAENTI